MLISGAIYLTFSFLYFTLAYLVVKQPKKEQQIPSPEKESPDFQNKTNSSTETEQIFVEVFSYKKKNLTIEIPDNEAFVELGHAAFVVVFLRENLFPLSQKYLKSAEEKFSKLTKWFLTVSLELTFSLYFVKNGDFHEGRETYYFLCPLLSFIASLLFAIIFTIVLRRKTQEMCPNNFRKWLKNLSLYTIWVICCYYHFIIDVIFIKISEIDLIIKVQVITFLSEVFVFEFIRTSMKMTALVFLKEEKILEDFLNSI